MAPHVCSRREGGLARGRVELGKQGIDTPRGRGGRRRDRRKRRWSGTAGARRGITGQPGTKQRDAPEGARSLGEGSNPGPPHRAPARTDLGTDGRASCWPRGLVPRWGRRADRVVFPTPRGGADLPPKPGLHSRGEPGGRLAPLGALQPRRRPPATG